MFPAWSPIRRAARAVNAIPMAGRMVLMELAHPAIAAAVHDHDRFRRNPILRAQVTAKAIGDVIHGSVEEAQAVSQRLAGIHDRVNGPGYAASEPALLMWVAATYFDSVLLATALWRQPFSEADRTEFFSQMQQAIDLLGCPIERQPQSLPDFHRYVAATLDELTVSDTALDLVRRIFWPSAKRRHDIPMALYRLVSFGHLPDRLRAQFGYHWTERCDRALRLATFSAPTFRPIADASLRRLADGRGRTLRVLMSVGGYSEQPRPTE